MKSIGQMFKRKKGGGEPEEEQQLQTQQSADSDIGADGGDSLPRSAAIGPAIGEGVDLPAVDQSSSDPDSPPHHAPPPPPPPPPISGNDSPSSKLNYLTRFYSPGKTLLL